MAARGGDVSVYLQERNNNLLCIPPKSHFQRFWENLVLAPPSLCTQQSVRLWPWLSRGKTSPKKLLSSGQSQAADCGPAATAVTIGGTSSRDGKRRVRAPEPRSGQMCARQPNGGFVRLLVPICSAWPFFPLPALGTHPNLRVVNLHNLPSEALGVFVDIFSFGITLQCIRLFTSHLVSSLGFSLTC